ncbi:lysozyme [Dyella silvatica]|uniref:lysozyme n=1 Tax=Dyella silvatica TaxID=2992128 RepID=UPI003CCDA766
MENEGERLTAYPDTNGTWTIGIGHTGPEVYKGLTITQEASRKLLVADVATAADTVIRVVRVALTGPQLDALIALTFNIGVPRFLTSTVLRRVNAGDFANVPNACGSKRPSTV